MSFWFWFSGGEPRLSIGSAGAEAVNPGLTLQARPFTFGSAVSESGAGGLYFTPPVPEERFLLVGPAISGAVTGGFSLIPEEPEPEPPEPPPPDPENAPGPGPFIAARAASGSRLRLQVHLGTRPGHPGPQLGPVVAELYGGGLPPAFGKTWQDVLNDPGSGSFTLAHGDPRISDIDFGHAVRWMFDHRTVFTSLIEHKEKTTAAEAEESGQNVVFSGRGLVACMDNSVVYPWGAWPFGNQIMDPAPAYLASDRGLERQPNTEQRVFNWASPSLPTWGTQEALLGSWRQSVALNSEGQRPESWPCQHSVWIWDRANAGLGAASSVPLPRGTCYYRHRFFTPSNGQGGYRSSKVQVWAAVGGPRRRGYSITSSTPDSYELWIDGVKVLESEEGDPTKPQNTDLTLSPGEHIVSVKATNGNSIAAGLIVAIVETDGRGGFSGHLAYSDPSWRVLSYPIRPPGHTVGRVMLCLIREAQARGGLRYTNHDFNEDIDDNGRPWPIEPEIVVPVGATYLEVLEQLSETYCDYNMGPGSFHLRMWRIDERGSNRLQVFTGAEGELYDNGADPNVTSMNHTLEF